MKSSTSSDALANNTHQKPFTLLSSLKSNNKELSFKSNLNKTQPDKTDGKLPLAKSPFSSFGKKEEKTEQKPRKKLCIIDSSSDDESLLHDVNETLKKCALSPRTENFISQHTSQNSSVLSSQKNKFEESSDEDDIELFAGDKICEKKPMRMRKVSPEKTPPLATPPKCCSVISKTQVDVSPHAPSLLDSPCTYSRGALPLLPSPKPKLMGRSQASPIVKHMNDDDQTCAMLCSKIMSTKLNMAPKSPLRNKFSMNDIIQFTQQQSSQKDFETEIDYNVDDFTSGYNENFSQNSDPLLAQLRGL